MAGPNADGGQPLIAWRPFAAEIASPRANRRAVRTESANGEVTRADGGESSILRQPWLRAVAARRRRLAAVPRRLPRSPARRRAVRNANRADVVVARADGGEPLVRRRQGRPNEHIESPAGGRAVRTESASKLKGGAVAHGGETLALGQREAFKNMLVAPTNRRPVLLAKAATETLARAYRRESPVHRVPSASDLAVIQEGAHSALSADRDEPTILSVVFERQRDLVLPVDAPACNVPLALTDPARSADRREPLVLRRGRGAKLLVPPANDLS